ncbi:glycoside hydrolase family 130 protein [Oryzibacter oryziterrae]|uniref:glycoside hydrolase family 130 protein n=1 Tax=Oryzibacter oryziterrae TaxID=2766474 RepID=UPI001F15B605|nr:glycoside hydrolase family 130 protein [Oryzibacter oryziterrae]
MSILGKFQRLPIRLYPDPARVIVRPFRPATEPRNLTSIDKSRVNRIVDRVLAMSAEMEAQQLAHIVANFEGRHRNFLAICRAQSLDLEGAFVDPPSLSDDQRQLVGAYFLHEYSFEASALFNPSIVPHPDQSDLSEGDLRFVLSLRAVGEGHISSLTFQSGVIRKDGNIQMDMKARYASLPLVTERTNSSKGEVVDLTFDAEQQLGERVIFPVTEAQANGIEDARFVAFDDEGTRSYHATVTAYSGRAISSQLVSTCDFVSFRLQPLFGNATGNKGMALFPRKIDGLFAMIGRQDNENLYYMTSTDLRVWNDGVAILKPLFPWEFIQLGNCGSPIELDEGWLVFTHGVGPVRKYVIGAVLLDKADPTRVLGRTAEPLISPEPSEREGYVPNVVYTCGGLRHGDRIVLPYAVSDTYTNFAMIPIVDLLALLQA